MFTLSISPPSYWSRTASPPHRRLPIDSFTPFPVVLNSIQSIQFESAWFTQKLPRYGAFQSTGQLSLAIIAIAYLVSLSDFSTVDCRLIDCRLIVSSEWSKPRPRLQGEEKQTAQLLKYQGMKPNRLEKAMKCLGYLGNTQLDNLFL